MSFEYIQPSTKRHTSRASELYCTSDVHLGNERWTNDLHRKHNATGHAGFIAFLGEVAAKVATAAQPGNINLDVLDLVLHGDIFDFWKAIPNPLHGEHDFELHSDADYVQRFAEILDYNDDVLWQLCLVIYHHELKVGAHLYILPGNHDEASPQLIATELRPRLLRRLAAIARQNGLIPPTGEAAYVAVLEKQVHWGAEQVYDNTLLLVHIQHGHRWDNANLPRRDNNTVLLAEGQVLVESFLNGLHDLNLCTFQYPWERLREQLMAQPAPRLDLEQFGRHIDNFDSELGAADYLRALVAQHGGELDALLRNHSSATFWQMDWKGLSAATSMSLIATIGEFFAGIGYALKRELWNPVLRQAGIDILDGKYIGVWPTVPKVVVMGHSHVFDLEPFQNPSPASRQYINSGTWVDVFRFDPANPTTPQRLSYERPVHCRSVSLPSRHVEVNLREQGSWRTQALIRLP